MKAFHGDPAIKAKYLARVEAHRKADEVVQGQYWEQGRGCAVGCTIHGDDHSKYERELGIPESIAHLEDGIFEGLPPEEARDWPGQFLESIPVGADLDLVVHHFILWMVESPDIGLGNSALQAGRNRLEAVAGLLRRMINGDRPTDAEWAAVQEACMLTGFVTAEDASYVHTDERAACWVVWHAAASRAERRPLYRLIAGRLLELLRSAPVMVPA